MLSYGTYETIIILYPSVDHHNYQTNIPSNVNVRQVSSFFIYQTLTPGRLVLVHFCLLHHLDLELLALFHLFFARLRLHLPFDRLLEATMTSCSFRFLDAVWFQLQCFQSPFVHLSLVMGLNGVFVDKVFGAVKTIELGEAGLFEVDRLHDQLFGLILEVIVDLGWT